ncbi:Ger(x)C family spore germination protein [Lentibacillus jeotgali]|uniref:Ger(x)C family spore germination protein n=1 Tax=Lentibacillus jeotgali TaxID=558169 RepID=UPI000262604F|nr:Ger(x)C family spore germination protein [Lentibacillus jeotgali]
MYLKYIAFFVLVIVSLLFNTQMPTKIIDQIQMITVAGFDATDQDKIQGTVVTPKYLQQAQVEDYIYTDTADTVYGDWVKLNAKATERLLNGKLKVAFYNQKLAEQGLSEFTEFLLRDPSIGGNVFLALAEGSSEELIKSVKTGKGRGIFFSDFFEHNIKHGNLPQTNLKLFNSSLKSDTSDPFMPMFSIEGGVPELTALAFFNGDKYVDKLPIVKANVFKLLYENLSDGQYQYKSDAYNISIENLESDRDVVYEAEKGSGGMTFNVKVRGVIREYTGQEPTDRLPVIQKDIEQDLEQKAEKLINRFQELNIDPLAIEEEVKSRNRNYTKDQFKSAYPDMPINVNVNVRLTESGTRR